MNLRSHINGIVADGLQRIRGSAEFQKRVREIELRVSQEYACEMANARWWKKLLLRHRMQRQIQKELDLIAPRGALYLHSDVPEGGRR